MNRRLPRRRRMRWVALAALALGAQTVRAELGVTFKLEHSKLMQLEPVVAFVTVTNMGWSPIVFSATGEGGAAKLDFVIRTDDSRRVQYLRGGPPPFDLTLAPREGRRLMVELSTYYDMQTPGGYFLQVDVLRDGTHYRSQTVNAEVVTGLPLLSESRALADGGIRDYTLSYLAREQRETLFLRIDDARAGLNHGVIALGPIVRVFQPQIEIDPAGTITILHQSGARQYTRSTLWTTGAGVRLVDQKHEVMRGKVGADGKWKMELPPP